MNVEIKRIKNHSDYILSEQPSVSSSYTGYDIEIFDEKETWYDWYKDLYNLLFNQEDILKDPHPSTYY